MLDALNALLKASKKPMCASEIYAADLIGLFESESDCAVKLGNMHRDGYLDREKKANPKAGKSGARTEVFFYSPLAKPIKKPASTRPSRAEKRAAMREPEPDDEAMPPADPILLAGANRMLHERLEGVAHVLRGCGLPGLASIDAGEDLQQYTASLAGAYQQALAKIEGMETRLIERSKQIADLSAARKAEPKPTHYACVVADDGMNFYPTIKEARQQAEQSLSNDADIGSIHLVSVLATAELGIHWKEAA